jgi:outer membrane protein insertion porin family
MRIASAAWICLTLSLLPGRLPASSDESVGTFFGKVIRSVDYDASEPLDRSRYDPIVGLKPGEILTRTAVKASIQTLYDTGKFSSIAVEARPDGDGLHLIFKLGLNTYFHKFAIDGKLNLGGRSLWEVTSLPLGERFSPERLEDARREFVNYLHQRGYLMAQVQAETEAGSTARQINTIFKVTPGNLATIRSIEVQGVPPAQIGVVRERLGLKEGRKLNRPQLRRRLEKLRRYFRSLGYLAGTAEISESFNPQDNSLALTLKVSNIGKTRVTVEGIKIDRDRLRRLLPVLSGAGVDPDLIREGILNLQEYLSEQGYPTAEVEFSETIDDQGVRLMRYRIDTGKRVTVSYVRFRGNRAISERELMATTQFKLTRFFRKPAYSVSKLDSDVESLLSLYRARGYLNARILSLIQPFNYGGRVGITFECEEGSQARVQEITIDGNRAIKSETLLAKMSLKAGGAYSPHFLEQDRQAILAAYSDAGFLHARATYEISSPDKGRGYSLALKIEEATQSLVDDILILGSDRTRTSVLRRRIQLRENEPLSLGRMLETQQAISRLGVFDFVRVTPQNPESEAPRQNVVIRLADAKRFTVRYGLGYQERERLRGTLELGDTNFLGTGRRADLRLRGSRLEQGALLSFMQPQFRFLPLDSYFTFSARRKKEVSFDSTRVNLSYQYGRPLSGHSWALARYNFRNVRVYNLQVSSSELGREDTPRNLSTFSAIYINDSRDDYIDPERGFFTSTDLSLTTKLLGSNNYLSLYTQNSYYRRLPGSLLMAASLRIGLSKPYGGDESIPISERFFAGGGSSLRGFDTDLAGPLDPNTGKPVGGNALLINSWEIRAPLLRSLYLAAFYDIGNVFRTPREINVSGLNHTVGIGLRLKTPLGPLRADYGFNLNLPDEHRGWGYKSRHFFFTIGPPF